MFTGLQRLTSRDGTASPHEALHSHQVLRPRVPARGAVVGLGLSAAVAFGAQRVRQIVNRPRELADWIRAHLLGNGRSGRVSWRRGDYDRAGRIDWGRAWNAPVTRLPSGSCVAIIPR